MIHVRAFLKDKKVCSILSTTDYCVDRILSGITIRPGQTILEYGPGDGALTFALLEKMHPDSRLIAIETNTDFVNELREKCSDPRLMIVHDTAENVAEIAARFKLPFVDYVISGIPFSVLEPEAKKQLIADTKKLLSSEGIFFVYQALILPLACMKTKECIAEKFVIRKVNFLLPNLPPLFLMQAHAV